MTTTNVSHRTVTTIHFSRRMLIGLAAVVGLPWAGVALFMARDVPLQPKVTAVARALPAATTASSMTFPVASITQGKPGPWGTMQYVPIVLEVPDEYLFLSQAHENGESWTFTGKTREAATAVMKSCGFSDEQLQLAGKAVWTDSIGTATVKPSDELILSLSSEVRSRFYNTLALDKANASSIDPYWFREGKVDSRLRGSDLSPESLTLLKRLLYTSREGDALLFADVRPALRSITDPVEQKKFAKAVTRKRSLMARLMVDSTSDVNAIAEYWGADGRQKDLVPFLNALKYNVEAGIEEPSMINIVTLLPSFARERLYNHAYATPTTTGHQEDCFWTAFNFFSLYPDNGVNDMKYLSKVLERDYYKIGEPTKLGDVVLILDETGEAVHAANYIADDIVFTKNGVNFTQPWMLVPLADMVQTYKVKNTVTKIAYFRRK